jgi:hypothetical protein
MREFLCVALVAAATVCCGTYPALENPELPAAEKCLPEGLYFLSEDTEAGKQGVCCENLELTEHAVYDNELRACLLPFALVCIRRGDGVCGAGEDFYNCPDDCPDPHARGYHWPLEDERYQHPEADEVVWCTVDAAGLWSCEPITVEYTSLCDLFW